MGNSGAGGNLAMDQHPIHRGGGGGAVVPSCYGNLMSILA